MLICIRHTYNDVHVTIFKKYIKPFLIIYIALTLDFQISIINTYYDQYPYYNISMRFV